MQKQDATFLLYESIQRKEIELAEEKKLLKEQFGLTVESLKPINLLKRTLMSPGLQNKAVDMAIGMTSGYLAKKIVVRSSHNPLLKMAGAILQIGVANIVAKNPESIKSLGVSFLQIVSSMSRKRAQSDLNTDEE